MEYFDRKEEVIDLGLTPYGKRLLSQGRLKPVYYAFYDDDVIYDTTYGGYVEVQKESEDRIKSTPRTKAQTILDGIESNFAKINEGQDDDKKLMGPSSVENLYGLPTPIGNGSLNSYNPPAWDIRSLQSALTASSEFLTGSHGMIRVPQIDINIFYDTLIGETTEDGDQPTQNVPGNISPGSGESDVLTVSKVYTDGTFVKLYKDYILLDIKEINGVLDKEAFEIEVYEVKDFNSSKEELRRLKFLKDGIEIQHDDIIYDPNLKDDVNLTDKYVEYFFDLRVDDEIEKPLLSETQKQIISLPTSDEEPCLDEPI